VTFRSWQGFLDNVGHDQIIFHFSFDIFHLSLGTGFQFVLFRVNSWIVPCLGGERRSARITGNNTDAGFLKDK
jgi:hypothetical protein